MIYYNNICYGSVSNMGTASRIETIPQYSGVFYVFVNFVYFLGGGLCLVYLSNATTFFFFFFGHVHSIASVLGFVIHSRLNVHSYLFSAVECRNEFIHIYK